MATAANTKGVKMMTVIMIVMVMAMIVTAGRGCMTCGTMCPAISER
jgi:hypothetical protein